MREDETAGITRGPGSVKSPVHGRDLEMQRWPGTEPLTSDFMVPDDRHDGDCALPGERNRHTAGTPLYPLLA